MSKYLEAFQKLDAEFGATFQLTEDVLLVEEIVPQEIKTKSGLIVGTNLDAFGRNAEGVEVARAHYVRILKLGSDTPTKTSVYDEATAKYINLGHELKPGYVINVGPNSVLWYSTVFNTVACKPRIGLTRASEALSVMTEGTYEKLGALFKEIVEGTKDDSNP